MTGQYWQKCLTLMHMDRKSERVEETKEQMNIDFVINLILWAKIQKE